MCLGSLSQLLICPRCKRYLCRTFSLYLCRTWLKYVHWYESTTYERNNLKTKRNCVCMPFLTYKNSDVKIKKSISIGPTQISGINARPRNQAYKNTSSFIIFPKSATPRILLAKGTWAIDNQVNGRRVTPWFSEACI